MKPSSHDLYIFRRYLEAENQGCKLLRTCTQAGVPEWHCGCARTWVGRWLRGPGKAWSLEGWILEHESIGSDKRPHSSGFSDAFTSPVLFSTARRAKTPSRVPSRLFPFSMPPRGGFCPLSKRGQWAIAVRALEEVPLQQAGAFWDFRVIPRPKNANKNPCPEKP